MRRAVCPASFDPVTNGHLDVIARTARLFDEVVVAVGVNVSKSRLFDPEERLAMLERATADLANVRVQRTRAQGAIVEIKELGHLVLYVRDLDASVIVKGLRGSTDYEYELPMAHMNSHLTGVETVFVPAAVGNAFVSSSLVKEVAGMGGDIAGLVPEFVREALLAKLSTR